jgi:hypothetical protein
MSSIHEAEVTDAYYGCRTYADVIDARGNGMVSIPATKSEGRHGRKGTLDDVSDMLQRSGYLRRHITMAASEE